MRLLRGAAYRHMRVLLIALLCASSLAGCRAIARHATPANPSAEALFRTLFETALTQRDSAALSRALAPEFIFHARGSTARVSPHELWSLSQPILRAFPDIQFRVHDVVAAGEKAAARVHFTGTQRGRLGSIAPTGRKVEVTEMFFCRIEAGLLAECWQEWDEHGLRLQLGAAR